VRVAGPLLGHTNLRTTEKHYNQARSLEAARQYQNCLLSVRRELRGPRTRARRR
jgi:hypothetical protein